ncbi:MAG TPA: PEP-CTERM sorting domain-containing protein [Phycisphaerae bacterium]|nr:PEP-CTERM sorting domain-containing protein [Phycisphaerae bacterium]
MTRTSIATTLCVAMFATAPASADLVMLSVADNLDAAIGGLTGLEDIDVVQYNTATDSATIILQNSDFDIGSGDTNAVHYMPNGNIVMSNLFNAQIAGLAFEDDDLVEYNPNTNTASLLFDGSALFDSTAEDIDAVYVRDNGNIVMSTLADAGLGGLSFGNGDIIEYNPNTDTATLLVAESDLFDDGAGNVDAVHILENGNLLISALDTTETVSGIVFNDGDVFEYNPLTDTASLYMSESVFTSTGLANDIDGFTLVPEPGTFGLLLLSMGYVLRRRVA